MGATILSAYSVKLTIFAFIVGTRALPQWLNGLRRDPAYAPAAYNPVYGPRDGVGGYTYGGYGPQPNIVTTSSTAASSKTTSASFEVFTPTAAFSSSTTAPSTSDTSSNNAISGSVGTTYSTSLSRSISSTTIPIHGTTSITSAPLVCNHDNCLRQLLRATAANAFCATYTAVENVATAGLPTFVSHCSGISGLPSRISSACSCLPTLTSSASTSSTTSLSSSSRLMSTIALSSSMTSLSASATTSVGSGVEPTTTTIIHVTVTSPVTVWYTPPVQIGTSPSSLPSSSSETAAPYPLSNQTSLVGPTGTGSSSIPLGTSPLDSVAVPTSSMLGTAGTSNSSLLPVSSAPYPMSNSTSAAGLTGSLYGTAIAATNSNSSSYGVPTHSYGHYHSGKSVTILPTGVSTSHLGSTSLPTSSSGANPYFPISNSSSIAASGPTASGSVSIPLSTTMATSPASSFPVPYYPAGNSSLIRGPTGTEAAPTTSSNPVKYMPIYPAGNSSSTVGPTGTFSVSSSSPSSSGSFTDDNSPASGPSTPYSSMANVTSSTAPVGTGSVSRDTSSPMTSPSSAPYYYVPSNSSSFSSPNGTGLPTLSSDILTTDTSTTAYGTGAIPSTTGTTGPLSSSLSSFGPYSNSTSSGTTQPSSTPSTTFPIPTMPVYALPTHHEGHHKHHSGHNYNEEEEDEVDIFFIDA